MSAGQPPVVFLHSMWRARSTWLFSRFRAAGRFNCFYEPLNERLATLTREDVSREGSERSEPGPSMHHPSLESGYWAEYAGLLRTQEPGVEGYSARFAFHPFDERNDPAPYLERLIAAGQGAPTLLEICRSPFRLHWLVARFPEAIHYYLERDPGDQFLSYSTRPNYFLPAHLAYASLQPDLARSLAREFRELMPGPWKRLRGWRDFGKRRAHFRKALERVSEGRRRAVFDRLWNAARDDARGAGLRIVDMDDLSMIESSFAEYGLRFDDYVAGRTRGDGVGA